MVINVQQYSSIFNIARSAQFNIGFADNSTLNILAQASGKADYNTQHSKRYAANFIIRRLRQAPMAS